MKIIVRNSDNVCVISFADDVTITASSNEIAIKVGEETRVYQGYNSSTVTIYDDVTLPDDYAEQKYKYDGSNFTANSAWINPSEDILKQDKIRYVQMNTYSETFINAVQAEIDRLSAL